MTETMTMYAVGEKQANIGGVISRDQSRLWVKRLPGTDSRDLTPCSNEALEFESREEAEAVAAEIGDSFAVIEVD